MLLLLLLPSFIPGPDCTTSCADRPYNVGPIRRLPCSRIPQFRSLIVRQVRLLLVVADEDHPVRAVCRPWLGVVGALEEAIGWEEEELVEEEEDRRLPGAHQQMSLEVGRSRSLAAATRDGEVQIYLSARWRGCFPEGHHDDPYSIEGLERLLCRVTCSMHPRVSRS